MGRCCVPAHPPLPLPALRIVMWCMILPSSCTVAGGTAEGSRPEASAVDLLCTTRATVPPATQSGGRPPLATALQAVSLSHTTALCVTRHQTRVGATPTTTAQAPPMSPMTATHMDDGECLALNQSSCKAFTQPFHARHRPTQQT